MICYAIIGVLYLLGFLVSVAAVHYTFKISDGEYAPPSVAIVLGLFWPATVGISALVFGLKWFFNIESTSRS